MSYWFLGVLVIGFWAIRRVLGVTGWSITGMRGVEMGRFGDQPAPWGLGSVLVAFLLALAGQAAMSPFVPGGGEFSGAQEMHYFQERYPWLPPVAYAISIGMVLVYLLAVRRIPLRSLGLAPGQFGRGETNATLIHFLGTCTVALVLFTSLSVLVWRTSWNWTDLDPGVEATEAVLAGPLWFFLVNGVVMGPILEELLFRGLLYPVASRWLGVALGVLSTATLFSLMHIDQGMYGFLSRFAVGIFLALAMEKTGVLYVPMLVHGGYNLASYAFHRWVT